ncbi:MAG: hypothetical protein F6J93_12820 [Oscillatoria sp. SIO1A7]|nr:hypothetical protein [Oscillatoria sp. SIO1A7]
MENTTKKNGLKFAPAAAILEVSENVVKELEELYEEQKRFFDKKMKILMPNGKIF